MEWERWLWSMHFYLLSCPLLGGSTDGCGRTDASHIFNPRGAVLTNQNEPLCAHRIVEVPVTGTMVRSPPVTVLLVAGGKPLWIISLSILHIPHNKNLKVKWGGRHRFLFWIQYFGREFSLYMKYINFFLNPLNFLLHPLGGPNNDTMPNFMLFVSHLQFC